MGRRSYPTMDLQRRLGGALYSVSSRILLFFRRELILSILLALMIALCIIDKTLTRRITSYIDFGAIEVIASVMIASQALVISGAIGGFSSRIVVSCGGRARESLILLLLLSAATATIVLNDAALFIFIPIAVTVSRILGVDKSLAATLVTIAVNIGSSLTPIGNPQNIIIWRYYDVPFPRFIYRMSPFVSLLILMLVIYTIILTREHKAVAPRLVKVKVDYKMFIVALASIAIVVFTAELNRPIYGLASTIVLIGVLNPRLLATVDYALIVMFMLMFVDFREISALVARAGFLSSLDKIGTFTYGLIASQVMSNVPATILLLKHTIHWRTLAIAVNVGGVGTIIGSIANIITVRIARVGLKSFHKTSIPFFAAAVTATIVFFILH